MRRTRCRALPAVTGLVLFAACSAPDQVPSVTTAPTVTQTVEAPAAAPLTLTETAVPATVTALPASAGPVGLEFPAQQWTMTVIGDSTGTQANGWVHYLGKRLGQAYQRPVTIYDWDLYCACYDEGGTLEYPSDLLPVYSDAGSAPAQSGIPDEAEIVIWNGSAAGKTGDYALDNFDEMVPETPNLVIINHGHNNDTSEDAVEEIGEVATTLTDLYGVALPIFITQQNPRFDFDAEKAYYTAELLDAGFGDGPYCLIDVFGGFEATGDLESVMTDDGLHPSEPGSILWADIAARAIGIPAT